MLVFCNCNRTTTYCKKLKAKMCLFVFVLFWMHWSIYGLFVCFLLYSLTWAAFVHLTCVNEHVHWEWKSEWSFTGVSLFLRLPVELSDSDHSCASFFWWLFRLFPMVTPYPTTTGMLKGALKRVTWHECRSMRPQKMSFTTDLSVLQKKPSTPFNTKIRLLLMLPHYKSAKPPSYQ